MAAIAPKKPRPPSRAAKPRKLAEYRGKRDFQLTAEPAGRVGGKSGSRFVIQKHAASRLHYDFRLEVDGVLKSWAIPKEIPLRVGGRSLAVMVEDHPLDYGDFEGTIPRGQYGGGTVMLWDRGTFKIESPGAAGAIRDGKLHLHLDGKKLRGEWALVRMRDDEKQWLLIKAGESLRPTASIWDLSAATSRTMETIAAGKRKATAAMAFVEPMKAKPAERLPEGKEWLCELKFDGYRFLALKTGGDVKLLSRTENDFTARFPAIAEAIAKLKCEDAVLDGELVVPDEAGRPSFQLIQNADETTPVQAFVFDLLHLDGEDLRRRPLDERREALRKLLPKKSARLHFSPELTGDPARVLAEVAAKGLEGLIAKRRASTYEAGRRGGAWVKVKCLREQEFVIGGFTPPKGARECFGALLIGCYREGKLRFAGKVGTGFDSRRLRALHGAMSALRIERCPFADLPRARSSRWGQPITRAEMARCTWTKPTLVCQVRFAEWTEDGVLRQPAFLGMREDKAAREVVRET